jgi:hypothetical protein
MFGISAENVIEHRPREATPASDAGENEAVSLQFNQTDPFVVRDGVDRLTVRREGDDRFLIDYRGKQRGYLWVTFDGVRELGRLLLPDDGSIPRWVLRTDGDGDDRPAWIPEDYSGEPTIACGRCNDETLASEIVTPYGYGVESPDRFCQRCWDELGERWSRETPDE